MHVAELTALETQSLEEIPHPSLGAGANLYGSWSPRSLIVPTNRWGPGSAGRSMPSGR